MPAVQVTCARFQTHQLSALSRSRHICNNSFPLTTRRSTREMKNLCKNRRHYRYGVCFEVMSIGDVSIWLHQKIHHFLLKKKTIGLPTNLWRTRLISLRKLSFLMSKSRQGSLLGEGVSVGKKVRSYVIGRWNHPTATRISRLVTRKCCRPGLQALRRWVSCMYIQPITPCTPKAEIQVPYMRYLDCHDC